MESVIPDFTGNGAGKEFERVCLERGKLYERVGRCTMSRYGVQASMIDGQWTPVASFPDIEGVLDDGHQFIFDCKVISGASFPLSKYRERKGNQLRQLEHLMLRSCFGVTAFLLLHFNSRSLKTKAEPASTWAVPVGEQFTIWREFRRAERNSISRKDAETHGVGVFWGLPSVQSKVVRPFLWDAICDCRARTRTLDSDEVWIQDEVPQV